MKRIICNVVLIVFCACGMSARVVERPIYKSSNHENRFIESVEVTDSATKINMSFVHIPKYWCVCDTVKMIGCTSGKEYNLRRVDNYTLGKRKYMPESGMYSFTLVYDPVCAIDTLVDLVEGEYAVRGLSLTDAKPAAGYHTHISGIYHKDETVICLMESAARPQSKSAIWIPVKGGKFSYDLYTDTIKAYELTDEFGCLKGHFYPVTLFSENADVKVEFILKNGAVESADARSVPEGLTSDFMGMKKRLNGLWVTLPAKCRRDSLVAAKAYFVPEYYELEERLAQHPEEKDSINARMRELYSKGNPLSQQGKEVDAEIGKWVKKDRVDAMIAEAVRLDNLAGLYMLQSEAWYSDDVSALVDTYRVSYAGKFLGHPYSEYFERLGGSHELVPGNKFNDFTAPGLDGGIYTLSEQIKGRPALIDLWASWCSPCRRLSKSMIPVYEEFAPKGFVIVGIAREFGSADAAVKAVKKDGYPWLNLVEIDDANGIWAKYRCPNSGGRMFLVDADGVIVAVEPTAEEVREYLAGFYAE